MKLTEYHRPTTLAEARRLLKELGPAGLPLAGATSHAFMKADEGRVAVDLAWIGYDRIEERDDGFAIGANTRIADLQAFKAAGWVLDRVALRFVNQQMRNMATLGGNIVRVFPWADFPVALLVLGADMVVAGDGESVHFADVYFKGQPARLFQPGDLLVEVRVPRLKSGEGFGYHKETVINTDFSRLTVAAWIKRDGHSAAEVRVAAGAGVPMPTRLSGLEDALKGRKLDDAIIGAAVEANLDAVRWKGGDGFSDAYVKQLARAHLADVIHAAWREAKGGAA